MPNPLISNIGIRNVDFGENVTDIEPFETLGYGTTMLIGEAVEKCGNNPVELAKYISGLQTFKTTNEHLTIMPSNDILPKVKIQKFEK